MRSLSIWGKLFILLLSIGILSATLTFYWAHRHASRALEQEAFAHLVSIRDIKKRQVESFFREKLADTEILSRMPSIRDHLKELEQITTATPSADIVQESHGLFRERFWKETDPTRIKMGFYDMFLIDKQGNVLHTLKQEDDLGTNLVHGTYHDTGLAKAFTQGLQLPLITDLEMYAPSAGKAVAFFAAPVTDDDGRTLGVLATQIDTNELDTIMQERSGLGETGETFLIGHDLLLRSDSRFFEDKTALKRKIDREAPRRALDGKTGTMRLFDYRNMPVLTAYAPLDIPGLQWAIIAKMDERELMAPIYTLEKQMVVGLIALSALLLVLSGAYAKKMSRPLVTLDRKLMEIADTGQYGDALPIPSNDEIGSLVTSFNRMSETIQRQTTELRDELAERRKAEEALNKSRRELERRVEERTAELSDANMKLRKEIEERTVATTELRKRETSLAEAQRIAHLGSWELDLVTNELKWSDEIFRIFEIDPERFEASYEAFLDAIHPDDRDAVNNAYTESVKKKTFYDIAHRLLMKDGRVKYVNEMCKTYYNDDGEPIRSVGTVHDITARTKAEEANRLKDKFVSLVAHDLKAPFASIMGMLKLFQLTKEPTTPDPKIMKTILESGENLTNMIDRVLEISRLQTGTMKPQKCFMDAREGAMRAIGMFSHLAQQKGIAMKNDVPAERRLYADPHLFDQVIQNLVSNAIKYCTKGDTITICMPPDKLTAIAVKDTGTGISPERIKSIFRHEEKTSTAGTDGEQGTGLGLPLSADIMKAHGGTLTAESTPGKGCLFCAQLPPVRPIVLVVDDEPIFRMEQRYRLTAIGANVIEAENGKEALEKLNGMVPHLVISDVRMPEMDGIEFLRNLKERPETRSVPVIIVSAMEGMEVRNTAFTNGAADFIPKPFAPDEFIPRVRRIIA